MPVVRLPYTLDDGGFIATTSQWVPIDSYPAFDEQIRAVKVYRTTYPKLLQYSIVTRASTYKNSYAWPACVAIRNELRMRFGQTNAIRFGIIPFDATKVSEWRKVGEFPDFREHHVHRGNPDHVIMSRDWVPVKRG